MKFPSVSQIVTGWTMRRREVRVGDRLVRSLHLGKWPRSLAPGFLQSLIAAGAPMEGRWSARWP